MFLKNYIRRFIPVKFRRKILRPYIVPSDYRRIVEEGENIYALRDTDPMTPSWADLEVRKSAHIIDKGLQRFDIKPGHSQNFYLKTKQFLSYFKSSSKQEPHREWAKQILEYYEKVQSGERLN